MAIEIVDFPMKNGGSFHCYVSSPDGNDGELWLPAELPFRAPVKLPGAQYGAPIQSPCRDAWESGDPQLVSHTYHCG